MPKVLNVKAFRTFTLYIFLLQAKRVLQSGGASVKIKKKGGIP